MAECNEHVIRPCDHNDWDDVRTRNGYKVLRCRVCQGQWKLPSQRVPRCMAFLHDSCDAGTACGMLHVRRKKSNILERYDMFGEPVLKGVARGIRRKARKHAASVRPHLDMPDDGGGSLEEVPSSENSGSSGSSSSSSMYTHQPYEWGQGVTPPEYM